MRMILIVIHGVIRVDFRGFAMVFSLCVLVGTCFIYIRGCDIYIIIWFFVCLFYARDVFKTNRLLSCVFGVI